MKPDTVLKWVRSGKLPATRTPGGHFRIDPSELQRFLGVSDVRTAASHTPEPRPLFCWEYMSVGESISSRCQNCLAYQAEAGKCWKLRGCLEGDYGLRIVPCESDCLHCALYDRIQHGVFRVLVVTGDIAWASSLADPVPEGDVEFRVASEGYSAAALLSDYCAALAVVDAAILREEPRLIERLLTDHRARGLVVAVAGKLAHGDKAPRGIVAQLGKPFGVTEIREIASWFPVGRNAIASPH